MLNASAATRTGQVCVRFWAAARDAAGGAQDWVPAGHLDDVLATLKERYGEQMAHLLAVSALLVDGERISPDASLDLPTGAVLEVLPPFAGG
ncbi:MAG: MoaD/ThiS family protein [Actinomycetes bacterium]